MADRAVAVRVVTVTMAVREAPAVFLQVRTGDVPAASGAGVRSVAGRTGHVVLTTADVGEDPAGLYFTPARAASAAPVQSVNGQTGDVMLDLAAAAPVQSVAGRGGHVVLVPADVSGLLGPGGQLHPDLVPASEVAAAAPVQSVAGRTGDVVIAAADVVDLLAEDGTLLPARLPADNVAGLAPVQSVAGRTGHVQLQVDDIVGLLGPGGQLAASLVPLNTVAAAAPVQSVNGRTGAVELTTADVGEDPARLYFTAARAAAAAPVQSVNGQTGDVQLDLAAALAAGRGLSVRELQADQSIQSETDTTVGWDTGLQSDPLLSYAGGTWTAAAACQVDIGARVYFEPSAALLTGERYLWVEHNGAVADLDVAAPAVNRPAALHVARQLQLAAGDTLRIRVRHDNSLPLRLLRLGLPLSQDMEAVCHVQIRRWS